MGVEVLLDTPKEAIDECGVTAKGGRLEARTSSGARGWRPDRLSQPRLDIPELGLGDRGARLITGEMTTLTGQSRLSSGTKAAPR
jgi:hypothetical protein